MRLAPLNLLGGFAKDRAFAWNVEDTVNYIPEAASSQGMRTPTALRGAPGLKPFVQITIDDIVGPAIRGTHNAQGKYFVVAGSIFWQIDNDGVAHNLGVVPGIGRVSIANNQIPGGNEILIGTGTPNGYVYNTVTEVYGRITDPGYPGTGSIDYVDSFLVQVEPFGRYWFWSDLAAAGEYNTLDRAEAEASPDPIVGLAVNNFEVVVFGQSTVEFFYNAGSATGTFQSKRIWIEQGCASRHSIVKLDNTLFWLSPQRILYRLSGYSAEPVSTPQFENAISGLDISKAFAFGYEDKGHAIYYITFPDGQTFGLDVTTKLMHRRQSYGLDRWRLNTLEKWGDKWIGGDFQKSYLYELDWSYPFEGEGTPLVVERMSGVTASAQHSITANVVELLFDTGQPEVAPVLFPAQPIPPVLPPAFAFMANDNAANTFQIGYGTVADDVFTLVAQKTYNAYGLTASPYNQALISYANRIIACIPFDNEASAGRAGVVALRYTGISTLTETDRYQYSVEEFNTYVTLGKIDDTLFVYGEDNDLGIGVFAVTYTVADGFTPIGTPLISSQSTFMVVHGDYIILAIDLGGTVELRAYSFNGSTFALEGTSATMATAVGLEWMYSNGSTIWCQNGHSWTFDGTTFVLLNAGGDTDVIAATFDGENRMIATDGDSLTIVSTTWGEDPTLALSPQHNGLIGIAYHDTKVYLPAGAGYDPDRSGVYGWNGVEFVRLDEFLLPTFTEPTACAIFKITELEE